MCYIFEVAVLTIYTVFSRNCFRGYQAPEQGLLRVPGRVVGMACRECAWLWGWGLASQACLLPMNGLDKDSHVCSQPSAGQAEKGLNSFTHSRSDTPTGGTATQERAGECFQSGFASGLWDGVSREQRPSHLGPPVGVHGGSLCLWM